MPRLIGYVAQNLTLGTSASRTARLKNVTDDIIRKLTQHNLSSLREILEWNAANRIRLYRISSSLIPYASHPVNRVDWGTEFRGQFESLGRFITDNGLVVGMHPGQYTLLSSPDQDITRRSFAEIEYHNRVLDLLGQGPQAKIVLHLGGAYGDKVSAVSRWIKNWQQLPPGARRRIVVEHDDRIYTVADCLAVHRIIGIPVVFDLLHYQLNPDDSLPYREALERCLAIWPPDITPEVHYSNESPIGRGAHSETVDVEQFKKFWLETADLEFNIILETKDKELSVLKIYQELGLGKTAA